MSNYPTCAHGKRLDGICYECSKLFYDARKDAPNHPSTTGSREKALPPLVAEAIERAIQIAGEAFYDHSSAGRMPGAGYSHRVYRKVSEYFGWRTDDAFKEWEKAMRSIPGPLSQARAEARASAFEEAAALAADHRDSVYIADALGDLARAARSSAGAEEGEKADG